MPYGRDFTEETPFYKLYKQRLEEFTERALIGDAEALLFGGIMGFIWCMFTLNLYLNFRQRKVMRESTVRPPQVCAIMSEEKYTKSRNYSLDENSFNMFHKLYSLLQITLALSFNIMPWLWTISVKSTIPWTKEETDIPIEEDLSEDHEIKSSLLFLSYLTTISFVDSMPWKLYKQFVIEENHGLNKQTMHFFMINELKSFGIALALIIPISYCLLSLIKFGGYYFYLDALAFSFVVMLFLVFIYPQCIAPIFDNLVPLPDGDLKTDIEDLAETVDFPLTTTFVVQESNRSSHSHMYFYGFWKNKRLVLFDKLVGSVTIQETKEGDIIENVNATQRKNGCSNEEVVAIIAHELGHWKMNHVAHNVVIGQLNLFLMFLAFGSLFNFGILFKTFGFSEVGTPSLIKLVLILIFLLSPYNVLLGFMMTLFSRQNEFQADNFVNQLGKGENLVSALVKLQKDEISFPVNDKWYSIFNHSHPPIFERINEIYKRETARKNILKE